MLRKIASCVTSLLLTASLALGGCLSCADYFMSPVASARHCCDPANGCKDSARKSRSSPVTSCAFQQMVAAKRAPGVGPAAIVMPHLAPSVYASFMDRQHRLAPIVADRGSPSDLYLLHSVLRI